ncbi:hypothetical protein ACFWFF_38530 [Streptomyces sp. NPDC060223]|uniref:hypothetical protein n=1 Tax=unclassified Streptomyces TaxID=2593676 RepID=UPI0036295FEB
MIRLEMMVAGYPSVDTDHGVADLTDGPQFTLWQQVAMVGVVTGENVEHSAVGLPGDRATRGP